MSGDENLRALARLAVAALCISAAVLALVVLTAGTGSHDASRAFLTAIVLAFLSFPAAAGARLARRQPGITALGLLTVLVVVVAGVLTTSRIWSDDYFGTSNAAHWTWYTVIGSFALGLIATVLAGHDDLDGDVLKVARLTTAFSVFALFVAVIAEVHTPGQRVNQHVLGGASIAVGLGLLLLPLLTYLDRSDEAEPEPSPWRSS